MYQILKKQTLNANTKLMVIEAPHVARKAEPGQFIILRVSAEGERIPLTIADFDREKGSVTIIFQEVGATTMALGALNAMMSGSGPTVFGLFDDPEKAQACYQALLSAKESGLAKQVYLTEPWLQPSRTSPSRPARL